MRCIDVGHEHGVRLHEQPRRGRELTRLPPDARGNIDYAGRVQRGPDDLLAEQIRKGTGAQNVELGPRLQSLWGGYGELRRVELRGARLERAIVKSVTPPAEREVRRDAAKLRSQRRKLRSYAVELAFYRAFAASCDASCRVPSLIYGEASLNRFLFVLEDLDRAGFPRRLRHCQPHEIAACLAWLAAFHVRFLGAAAEGLWKVGTYWHLSTRPDELAALSNAELRRAAPRIDERLNAARFKTLLHGDAKLENFCFSEDGNRVAAVDFQYTGGGVGVKDVVYLLSSCLTPRECATQVAGYLDLYFLALKGALSQRGNANLDVAALESEWRTLFPYAWVDFHRFLLGWAPSYAEGDSYSERLTAEVLAEIR